MKQKNYRWILYSITLVILGTIGIQVYWNYKNYESNKQEYISDIQNILDESIERYYANLAKEKSYFETTLTDSSSAFPMGLFGQAMDSLEVRIYETGNPPPISHSKRMIVKTIDSLAERIKFPKHLQNQDTQKVVFIQEDYKGNTNKDSLENYIKKLKNQHGYIDISVEDNFEMLTSQIVISLTNDSLDISKIDQVLKPILEEKSLNFDYKLQYKFASEEQVIYKDNNTNSYPLKVVSNSVYLPPSSSLTLSFTDIKYPILKRIYVGILISTILILAIISCLFYLLKIIQKQKQIGEIKNDFISNITHEFKTPIATISVALESIRHFNASQHPERSETYLDMSKEQLDKLNMMVEKLLETSTLDSNAIELFKEPVNIIELIQNVKNQHHFQSTNKTIEFKTSISNLMVSIDAFHFENVINNLIDNAIKYGGSKICIELRTLGQLLEIYVKDSGQSLTKVDTKHLFEKFYRQPKGNTHDVKGFGIGLYYSKKIIEKHQGQLILSFDKQFTIFKISMPYE